MDNKNKAATFWQTIATIIIWTMTTGGIALGGVFLVGRLGTAAMGFFFMLLAAAVICTGFVWDWGRIPGDSRRWRKGFEDNMADDYEVDAGSVEKRKNDRLRDALRALSDDELVRLRQRISRGEINEEDLANVLRDEIER